MKELFSLYPNLAQLELDGKTDFDKVALVIATRNPTIVWATVNQLKKAREVTPELEKLKKLLKLG